MKKIARWLLKIVGGLLLFCLLLAPFIFTTVDRTPYQEMPYYKEMRAQLDTFQLDTITQSGDYFKAGWAKKSITPRYLPDLAGYGFREPANCIHDSVFVRAFVFDNGKNKTAFLSVDLLIFPPLLEKKLQEAASKFGYSPAQLYLSATHSHSAPGGWAEGPAGSVLAGKYKEEYVAQLLDAMTDALKEAERNKEEAETGFGAFDASSFVRNRLNEPDSKTDPWIRVLKIKKRSGAQAALVVYSAHANCLKMNYRCISGDYPARMVMQMERSGKMEFAMYAAGMVGSHTPKPIMDGSHEMENQALVDAYGDSIAGIINKKFDSLPTHPGTELSTAVLDLPLRAPHLKILENWRVRPWLFDWAFGAYDPKLKLLKINNLLFIGTPCDFSGELMPDFQVLCEEKEIELIITSFNGGYIGYVNVDKYYDKDKAETRNMNWFGPYNQAYFTEVIREILKKI